ncbi:MAG: hypothetical protein IFK94_08050 [Acidobacteria bacterium]|uniref:Uncharacterized protein n=1 Tax=Candidatus Polarisedimenticola svalbardensis TaxID=2886004 RepID=A0A8J6XSW7_9BACT|nr:hypothetical protein [Candidatus Polarisedimenticola svalbardensis]
MPEPRVQERRRIVERLLEEMPPSLVEAKRFITENGHMEPEPRILQCMVKIAGDPAEEGPRREIPRALLALRTVVDDQLAIMNGDGSAAPETILAAAGVLFSLEQDLDRIEQDLAATVPQLAEDDKNYLNGLHQRLVPSREKMMTARMLARFFDLADYPALPADGGSPARDGAILLHLIGVDLAAWLNRQETADGERETLWRNLENDRSAYKTVSRVLAASKDTAFVEGPKPLYEQLNDLQRNLFSAYSRLSQVVIAGKNAGDTGEAAGDKGSDLDLNASIAAAEQAAAAVNEAREQRRDVMDDALRGVRESRTTPPKLLNYLEREEKDRKRRLRVMGISCGVLAVAAVVVNLMLLPPSGPVVDLLPEEFSNAMPLKQATAAAEVMLAETSGDLWDMWNPAERKEHVKDLVRQAEEKGFSSLWLTDEAGRQLALWEQGSELKLF